MKNIILIICVITFLMACEKNINFNLQDAADVLVVDAQIENDQPPTVVLTKSLDYFGKINPQLLANSFVHNADITISNGTFTHKLKEYSFPLAIGYTGYFYSIDSSNLGTAFLGEFNKQYSMLIKAEGKEYTAITTIPVLAKFPDSLWFKVAPSNPDTSKRVLMTKTTDPPGLGNYIRYYTKKNAENFLPGENSVFDDKIIDGTTYQLQIDPGIDRNNRVPSDSSYFKRGDTVTVKLCNIDKATYIFWNTWEFAQQSNGNPFSQPNKVISNISNGALGVFCGYAAWYKTIVAK